MNYLVLLLSILPVILIGLYYYKKDTQKEPKKLLQKLFFSGILSGIIVIIISFITILLFPEFTNIENANLLKIFFYSFIFVALTEELSKFIMIYKLSWNHQAFDQFYDIILYSVFVGLGFACFENILYVTSYENGLWLAIFRGLTAIPAHACFQTFMGYYLALSKFKRKDQQNYFYLSIFLPILLHGTYDFLLLSGNILLIGFFFVFIITMFTLTILKIKKVIKLDEFNLNLTICPNCKIEMKENYCPFCGHKKST